MRILYISNSTAVSGAPSALHNIVRELCGRHQIAVVLPEAAGPLYDALTALGVKCYCDVPYGLTIWPRVINPVKFIRRIAFLRVGLDKARTYVGKVIDEFKPDIVHTNVGPLDLAYRQCRSRRVLHVWHLREFQQGMCFWPTRSRFIRRIHSYGNRNIAITECVADYWNLRECDAMIYDGVKVDEGCHIEKSRNLAGFLFVGRVEKNKGLLELLKAYHIYRRNGGNEKLHVVGRSSLFYGLRCREYIIRKSLGEHVEFMGYRPDVPELMRKSIALVVPSLTEGFGLASVEAMKEGCLVIGNDTTGMKEQFDNGVRYTGEEIGFRYRGVRELAMLLEKVSANPYRYDDVRERALNAVAGLYDMNRKAMELEEYYKKILEDYR